MLDLGGFLCIFHAQRFFVVLKLTIIEIMSFFFLVFGNYKNFLFACWDKRQITRIEIWLLCLCGFLYRQLKRILIKLNSCSTLSWVRFADPMVLSTGTWRFKILSDVLFSYLSQQLNGGQSLIFFFPFFLFFFFFFLNFNNIRT